MSQIIEDRCVGCGICVNICPKGIEIADGKARIKNENADCIKQAANSCPRRAILLDEEESKNEEIDTNLSQDYNQDHWMEQGAGQGRGSGRGQGTGQERGMGGGRGGGIGSGRGRGGGRRRW